MNKFILILSFLVFYVEATIRASIKITKYEPLSFQLLFSQPITLPEFQILVDSNNLPYNVLNRQDLTSRYLIQMTSDYQIIDVQNTQGFSLVFNYPLDIQNGLLYLGDYVLSPEKGSFCINISSWPVYCMYICLVICSSFGIISLAVLDFIQIYILTELKFKNRTSAVQTFSSLFFFDNNNNYSSQKYLIRLVLPTLIVVGFYIFGIVIKQLSALFNNHFIKKRLVKLCSYNLFLTIWTIQLPSIIFKAFQFINDFLNKNVSLTRQEYGVGIFITYLNFINFLVYFYLLYFVLNPKINQEDQSFIKYMISGQFKLYSKFHRGLHLKDWSKRNTMLFVTIRKLVVIILFFLVNNIAPYVLGLQLVTFFFIFTARPYKQWFYTNTMILFNLLWFFFYIVVLQGFFYFDISSSLQTRSSLTTYLLAKAILFFTIICLGIAASVIQAVRLFKNLRYEFQQQREVKKIQSPIRINRGRLYTQTSEKMMNNMQQSLIFDTPNSPEDKRKKRPSNSSNYKGKLSLFQIELDDLSSPSVIKREQFKKRANKKWKDKSLFQQLAKD